MKQKFLKIFVIHAIMYINLAVIFYNAIVKLKLNIDTFLNICNEILICLSRNYISDDRFRSQKFFLQSFWYNHLYLYVCCSINSIYTNVKILC